MCRGTNHLGGLSCSASCGIFMDQRQNPCLLHWQVDSLLLNHIKRAFFSCMAWRAKGTLRFLPPIKMRPSFISSNLVESREASRGRERSSGHQQAGEERVSRPPPGDQEGSPLFCKLRITEFANLGKGTVGPWRTLGDWLGQKDLLPKPSAPSDVCRGHMPNAPDSPVRF